MARGVRHLVDVVAILGLGILCLPILLLLLPDFLESRGEARTMIAYSNVNRLRESLGEGPVSGAALPDCDPWERPYRVVPLADGGFRVLSSGPNRTSSANGIDEDDIYSDMPQSPLKPFRETKRRQSLIALSVTGGI